MKINSVELTQEQEGALRAAIESALKELQHHAFWVGVLRSVCAVAWPPDSSALRAAAHEEIEARKP